MVFIYTLPKGVHSGYRVAFGLDVSGWVDIGSCNHIFFYIVVIFDVG